MSEKSKKDEVKIDLSEKIDRSCSVPILFLAFSAIVWLLVYGLFSTIAGFRLLSPGWLADSAWLSYGRLQSSSDFALYFGFLVQLGLALTGWIFSQRGKTVLIDIGFIYLGGLLWNSGVTLGLLGIITGESSGLEGLQMPDQIIPILFIGISFVGISFVQTNNRRTDEEMKPSSWFLFVGLLWLPWILGGSYLLLYTIKVKGVLANIADWWFIQNFTMVYLTFVALGVITNFLNFLSNRNIGHRSAFVAFWVLLLFGSMGGVSPGAPVPAWLPALSTVSSVFYFVGVLISLRWIWSLQNDLDIKRTDGKFALFLLRLSVGIFAMVSLVKFVFAFPAFGSIAEFTTFIPAIKKLHSLGFVGLAMIASFVYIFPRLVGVSFSPTVFKYQTILLILGVFISTVPSAIGGLLSGDGKLNSGLYVSSVGNLIFLFGSFLLFLNFIGSIIVAMKNCDCLKIFQNKQQLNQSES